MFKAVIKFQDFFYIILGFFEWRNSFVKIDNSGAGIISRKGQRQLSVKAFKKLFEISCTSHYIFQWVKGVCYLKGLKVFRHDLHKSQCALLWNSPRVKVGLGFNYCLKKRKRNTVLLWSFGNISVIFFWWICAWKFSRSFPNIYSIIAVRGCRNVRKMSHPFLVYVHIDIST